VNAAVLRDIRKPRFASLPPLSLYVHLPWCVKKCPYCDFNSHEQSRNAHGALGELPFAEYVAALIRDLEAMLPSVWGRRLQSVFMGGGTPSLFPAAQIDALLVAVRARLPGVRFCTPHLSAYQLTIEPNTVFYAHPPALPEHDAGADMQVMIEETLRAAGFGHYETSAFARPGRRCRHNLNYWEFGDYLGIGAGAHGKLSFADRVTRHERTKQPREYLASTGDVAQHAIEARELPFEFMLNALRLVEGFPDDLFAARCGLPLSLIESRLALAEEKKLIERRAQRIRPTELGRDFLNDLVALFLPANE